MTPEGRVKRMVKKALDTLGDDCWRFMPVQTGYGAPALDYLLAIRGRFVAIETKAPGKKLTPLQEGTKAAIEAAGGIVLVVWDEGSLTIAMRLILALEFTPNDPTPANLFDHLALCIDASRGDYQGGFIAKQQKTAGLSKDAPDAANGRHHGAPGQPPKRQPE